MDSLNLKKIFSSDLLETSQKASQKNRKKNILNFTKNLVVVEYNSLAKDYRQIFSNNFYVFVKLKT